MQNREVFVIGAGLAGCEAAWQLARRGIKVKLYDMKAHKRSPAHKTDKLAELVCSNSLRANGLTNAVGLLKEEMRRLGSLIMEAADATRVPAGGALAVNREEFSSYVTEKILNEPLIAFTDKEITSIEDFPEDGVKIIATGPLTTDGFTRSLKKFTGEYLHFYDAAAPVVDGESIDMNEAFYASRYEKGSDYLNCPLTKEQYDEFYNALVSAECVPFKDFEPKNVFEGCMPVEIMAARGYHTLCYGPLKPKGIIDPKTGKEPFAVVQLRKEDKDGTMFNLVGFQTHLKFGEQKRVFSLIDALKNAEFLRYGVMHRNTFLNSPKILNAEYQLKAQPNIRFAGQITGVEGYVESAATGMMCGIFTALELNKRQIPESDDKTALGALGKYISHSASDNFQPMHINYGIIAPFERKIRNKQERYRAISQRALNEIERLKIQLQL